MMFRNFLLISLISVLPAFSDNFTFSQYFKQDSTLQGYIFTQGLTSEPTSSLSTSHCLMLCLNRWQTISFTFDGVICRCYNTIFDSLTDAIPAMNAVSFGIIRYSDFGFFTDCNDVQYPSSGVYRIFPANDTEGVLVYCDMDTDGGKWTMIQRRQDGSVDFYRSYEEYLKGFGNVSGEFYLGNEWIHKLTTQADYELRVDLTNAGGTKRFALYHSFSIGSNDTSFTLQVSGYNSVSDAGDSLSDVNQRTFKAYDSGYNCPKNRRGAWWYKSCSKANLNGKYFTPGTYSLRGVRWDTFELDISMLYADMKIRRKT